MEADLNASLQVIVRKGRSLNRTHMTREKFHRKIELCFNSNLRGEKIKNVWLNQ